MENSLESNRSDYKSRAACLCTSSNTVVGT